MILPLPLLNSDPLQYSSLENPRDRGAWWTAVYGVAQSRAQLKRQNFLFFKKSSDSHCSYEISRFLKIAFKMLSTAEFNPLAANL